MRRSRLDATIRRHQGKHRVRSDKTGFVYTSDKIVVDRDNHTGHPSEIDPPHPAEEPFMVPFDDVSVPIARPERVDGTAVGEDRCVWGSCTEIWGSSTKKWGSA